MKRQFLALSVLALIVSCSKDTIKEEHQRPGDGSTFAFSAGFADPSVGSKVLLEHSQFNKRLYVLWEEGDCVSVFDGTGNFPFYSDRLGVSANLLSDDPSFNKTAETYYALYPYDADAELSVAGDAYIECTLPSEQYATRDSFSEHLAVASASALNRNLEFKNVTAVFKATITTEGVTSMEFSGENEEFVAGPIKVSVADAEYSLNGECSKTITVHPPQGSSTFRPGRYYFTVLPQMFSNGFKVTINMTDSSKEERIYPNRVEIARSTLTIGNPIGVRGDGSSETPYVIENKYQLEALATIVGDDQIANSQTTYIEFEEDGVVDMTDITYWEPVNNSRKIEDIARLSIDGNNATITNFQPLNMQDGADGKDKSQPSLLGILYGEVRDLNIENSAVVVGDTMSTVGMLAGWAGFEGLQQTSVVENVHVSGRVKGKKAVGGLVAIAYNAQFNGCTANVTVDASDEHAGGLVARYYGNITLDNCQATGGVVGVRGTGGLLGSNDVDDSKVGTVTVTGCKASGDVSGHYQVGGLVGHAKSKMTISGSTATGDVTATARKNRLGAFYAAKQVGGILGVNAAGSVTLQNNYYGGKITADGCFIGGVLGFNTGSAKVSDCHAECSIENTGAYHSSNQSVNYSMIGVGGVVGGSRGDTLVVSKCFVDKGSLKSKAWGTMQDSPASWDEWIDLVRKKTAAVGGDDVDDAVGGGVGGIVGYVSSANLRLDNNISWLDSLKCERTNINDAPCAPIVGCLSGSVKNMANNRYYQDSVGNHITIEDACPGYSPLSPESVKTDATRNNAINSVNDGTKVNQYCLYNRPVSNTSNPLGNNSPSSTANSWSWSADLWNTDGFKPYLRIRPAQQ